MAFPKDKNEVDFSMGTLALPAKHGVGNVNEIEICTYDEAHVCSGGKYLDHIKKCRQRIEGKAALDDENSELKVCPFNPRHHVHHSVLDKHIEMCDGYYKYQMEVQKDPPSMLKSFGRYHLEKPTTNVGNANDDFDNASDFGEGDSEAPIHSVVVKDGLAEYHPKTRAEFRMRQEEMVRKLVYAKLFGENQGAQSATGSVSGFEAFRALPDMSLAQKMQDVAQYAIHARDKINSDSTQMAV